MKSTVGRRDVLIAASGAALVAGCAAIFPAAERAAKSETGNVAAAMKRATLYMREHCAHRGGYVWSYSADFSRRWGEMEAFPGMIWIQPPGTATVGHLYLDCYHATGDEFYYDSAADVASALIAAQHPSGGWNYFYDFAGEESIRRWYDTIGRNGWRLEEFHHDYGNATFDDAGTSEASQFLLRMYLEKRDRLYVAPLERALAFVLDSQYGNGGWPQRYPFTDTVQSLHDGADYTRHITFNDDVAGENIKFLMMIWQSLGDGRARAAIDRAMDIFIATQQPAPQAGWGLQHRLDDLKPVGARSYEPDALVTSTTASNISLMLDFYEWSGERKYLARIPQALEWLESVRLTPEQVRIAGREFPTFIEIGTNRALINHRRGSNVVNGAYYHDYSPERPIAHYSQWRAIDLDGLRHRYSRLSALSPADAAVRSPLGKQANFALPQYFTLRSIEVSDLNSNAADRQDIRPDPARVTELLNSLDAEGYWPVPLTAVSNTYAGDGPASPAPGDFSQTLVGDDSDTSPYATNSPETGISTGIFIQNMSALLQVFSSSAATISIQSVEVSFPS